MNKQQIVDRLNSLARADRLRQSEREEQHKLQQKLRDLTEKRVGVVEEVEEVLTAQELLRERVIANKRELTRKNYIVFTDFVYPTMKKGFSVVEKQPKRRALTESEIINLLEEVER